MFGFDGSVVLQPCDVALEGPYPKVGGRELSDWDVLVMRDGGSKEFECLGGRGKYLGGGFASQGLEI